MDSFEARPDALPVPLDVDPAQLALFAPYCGGVNREVWLVVALDLLPVLRLNGRRLLRPAGSHPFLLSWQPVQAPQEQVACDLSFPATPGLNYSFSVPAHQLVSWLMDLREAQDLRGEDDLPESFWRWLLLGESPKPAAA